MDRAEVHTKKPRDTRHANAIGRYIREEHLALPRRLHAFATPLA
jgi:hypothetical protein